MKEKTHNLKWYLFRWNFNTFELLFTYIHHSLASLSVLLKYKCLSWMLNVNLSLFLHHVSMLEQLCTLPALKVHLFWCKTGIYSWNLSEKVFLMYEDSFPIPIFCNLKYISLNFIDNSMKCSWKQLIILRACRVS